MVASAEVVWWRRQELAQVAERRGYDLVVTEVMLMLVEMPPAACFVVLAVIVVLN